MINLIWSIYASLLFVVLAKILSYIVKQRGVMYNKSGSLLTSIPEKIEEYEEPKKWVPKKKHEVLKAKYKCLKKLFQIYDASVIGILPETYETEYEEEGGRGKRTRRKRSNRTKTDASAGTTDATSGDDVTDVSETEKVSTIATAVMRDLKLPQSQYSCTSTQFEAATTTITNSKYERYATTLNSKSNITEKEYKEPEPVPQMMEQVPHPMPYLMVNEKPKLTRFQCFIHRIFGIKRESSYKNFVHLNGHIYAASDNNISPHYEKRRRRGLRFRKLRRPRKILSESALNVKSPMILTYVQSVQKNCLMDTTPRQCPISGCRMIFYGIINYNDHLNLCHFPERKFVCHYCHEGFEREYDKYIHENEHIGIGKLNANLPNIPSAARERKASITQTDPELTKCDVPEEKLKKIVSFFDKISDPEQIISEIKKNRFSECDLQVLQTCKDDCGTDNTMTSSNESEKRTVSCVNLRRRSRTNKPTPMQSEVTSKCPYGGPVTCQYCGESFDYRRQLSLHVDLEHRVHDKFSKFHSCAGITNARRRCESIAEDGKIDFKTNDKGLLSEDTLRRKSEESLSYEPSTNIVYYTSVESVNSKVPMGYKWEPGTKIIRV